MIVLSKELLTELVEDIIVPIEQKMGMDKKLQNFIDKNEEVLKQINFIRLVSILLTSDYEIAYQKLKNFEEEWNNLEQISLVIPYLTEFKNKFSNWMKKHISDFKEEELSERLQILYDFCSGIEVVEKEEENIVNIYNSFKMLDEYSKNSDITEEYVVVAQEILTNLIYLFRGKNYNRFLFLLKDIKSVIDNLELNLLDKEKKEIVLNLLRYIFSDFKNIVDNIYNNGDCVCEIDDKFYASIMKLKLIICIDEEISELEKDRNLNLLKFSRNVFDIAQNGIENIQANKEEDEWNDEFFDFDDSDERDKNIDNMHYSEGDKVDAKTFMENEGLDEDLIYDLELNLEELRKNTGFYMYVSQEYLEYYKVTLKGMINIFEFSYEFKNLATSFRSLYQFLENLDIDNLDKEKSEFLKNMLDLIYEDIRKWFEEVILNQTAQDIHYLDASLLANVGQIKIMIGN